MGEGVRLLDSASEDDMFGLRAVPGFASVAHATFLPSLSDLDPLEPSFPDALPSTPPPALDPADPSLLATGDALADDFVTGEALADDFVTGEALADDFDFAGDFAAPLTVSCASFCSLMSWIAPSISSILP
jgi:hypothetical protein